MSTVECPIQAKVNCASLHFEGSGLADAGVIERQLSMVHSRKRCPTQRRTREVRRAGPLDVSIQNKLERRSDFMRSRASDQRLPNNPLTAFQSVRAAFGGPARATSTGMFARFKMLRVRSPMI